MTSRPLGLNYGTSELLAVPAIHFDHVFACMVNGLCFGTSAPPAAIAVELGPVMAAVLQSWLIELGVGPSQKTPLPVMLGLLRRKRLIRPSLKEKAFDLQRRMGMDLCELSPEVLYRELGFNGQGLLCLSPTDSIIEAVRCGVELELPVYGIDLEDSADYLPQPLVFQDSLCARQDFSTYLNRNAPYAAGYRDESIDLRREMAMAARLKTLLERHQRVLFTGGMAHWESIRNLLEDDSIRPAPCLDVPTVSPEEQTSRVLVHPVIASRHLDRFPAMAEHYESWRNGSGATKGGDGFPDPAGIFLGCLKTANQNYFAGEPPSSRTGVRTVDLEGCSRFDAYLKNLSLLHHVSVPNLGLLATAARETMSKDFAAAMIGAFMKFPWASPEDFPDLPVILPAAKKESVPEGAVCVKDGASKSEPLYFKSLPGHVSHTVPVNIPYDWDAEDDSAEPSEASSWLHTWHPWDYLNASLCYRAIQEGKRNRRKLKTAVFRGNMMDGIDVKATVRDLAGGKERLHVRERVKCRSDALRFAEGFPVVWILDPSAPGEQEWIVLVAPLENIEKYAMDRERLQEVAAKRGRNMVSSVGYGRREVDRNQEDGDLVVRSDRYFGQIIFQVPCYSARQFARWAELTEYRRNPFSNSCSLISWDTDGLDRFGLGRHGIRPGEWHWTTMLILMGLRFAGEDLIVVAPRTFRIERVVLEKARACGPRVRQVALERFSAREVQRMSLCHMVSYDNPGAGSEALERCIGESRTAYRDLVPRQWLQFGGRVR